MRWRKVTLVGVGLLGGSLGLALKRGALSDRVSGYVRRKTSVAECLAHGVVDEAHMDLGQAVAGSDLVILCTPIARMAELAGAMVPRLEPGALVTDVGSVKGSVAAALEPIFRQGHGHFIGSHPMAGSEKTGVAEARADLFDGAICVIAPTPASDPARVKHLEALWKGIGGRPLILDPAVHDALVSRSSHLPHVLAAALARAVLSPGQPPEQALLCARGFKDTTRVASGSVEMWRDICAANREPLGRALADLMADLDAFRRALQEKDDAAVERFLEEAKVRRDKWRMDAGAASGDYNG